MGSLQLARRIGRYLADNAIAFLALLMALSGTAYAANTIGSDDIIDGSVQGVDIKNNTITRQDVQWAKWQVVDPPESSGNCATMTGQLCETFDPSRFTSLYWENVSGGYQVARFRRNANSEVALQGLVKTNVEILTYDLPVFRLPTGYRPMGTLLFAVACSKSGGGDDAGTVEVRADGRVYFHHTGTQCVTTGYVSLSGVTFPIG